MSALSAVLEKLRSERAAPVVQGRVDTCMAVAGSSISDESHSEGVKSDTSESDENDNGSVRMFAENGENDGSGSGVVATVAEIDKDEIDEGTTFAESGNIAAENLWQGLHRPKPS